MNYRAIIEVAIEKNERPYVLHLPVGAPFEECYEALKELSDGIAFLEKQAKDQAAAAAETAPVEAVEATVVEAAPASEITD